MIDPSDAKARTPRQPSPVRQDGAFQEGNAPYRAKHIAIAKNGFRWTMTNIYNNPTNIPKHISTAVGFFNGQLGN
jgi:hypothetical protein